MTFPSFTSGEVLRAADMNAVGLWLVKSQVVGSGVSSVTVTGAFSADYDNYKIVYSGGVGSTDSNGVLRLGASTTGYYGALGYNAYSGGAYSVATDNNSTLFSFVGYASANYAGASFDLLAPYLSKFTQIMVSGWTATTVSGSYTGLHQVATSYTDFTYAANGATLTGGTISVYGYKK
jgi:hypothetical protein